MAGLRILNLNKQPKPNKGFSIMPIISAVVLVILVAATVYILTRPSTPIVFTTIGNVLNKDSNPLKKDSGGRINILLLGIGGGNHDGANLTDTIIVASYNPEKKQVTLISLPRDLWSDKYKAKINSIYETGLKSGNGLSLTEAEVGDILGLEIPYAIRVDFSGFEKAVDLVGGLDINVTHSFDDYFYPIPGKEDDTCGYKFADLDVAPDKAAQLGVTPGQLQVLLDPTGGIATASASPSASLNLTEDQAFEYFGCRFERLSFKQGVSHMNGATALKFVRSRHGNNGEGSDFARSKRQQLVVQAFKDKMLSLNILTDVSKLISLANTFKSSVDTNIAESDYLNFAKITKDVETVQSFTIDTGGTHPLLIIPTSGDFGGAWALIPASKDYGSIHQFVINILSNQSTSSGSTKTTP